MKRIKQIPRAPKAPAMSQVPANANAPLSVGTPQGMYDDQTGMTLPATQQATDGARFTDFPMFGQMGRSGLLSTSGSPLASTSKYAYRVYNPDTISLAEYDEMGLDPVIRACLLGYALIMQTADFTANCPDSSMKALIESQFLPLIPRLLQECLIPGLTFGWFDAETLWEMRYNVAIEVDEGTRDGTNPGNPQTPGSGATAGTVQMDNAPVRIYPFVTAVKDFVPIPNTSVTLRQTTGGEFAGAIQWSWGQVFLPPQKLLHIPFGGMFRNPYGQPLAKPAYPYWYWTRFLYEMGMVGVERGAAPPIIGRCPAGMKISAGTDQYGRPVTIDGADYLLGQLRQLRSFASAVFPRMLDPNGQDLFSVEELALDMHVDWVVEFIRLCNQQKQIGMFFPDKLLQSGDVGSYALAKEHTDMFSMAVKAMLDQVLWYINNGPLRQFVRFNDRKCPDAHLTYGAPNVEAMMSLSQMVIQTICSGQALVTQNQDRVLVPDWKRLADDLGIPYNIVRRTDGMDAFGNPLQPGMDPDQQDHVAAQNGGQIPPGAAGQGQGRPDPGAGAMGNPGGSGASQGDGDGVSFRGSEREQIVITSDPPVASPDDDLGDGSVLLSASALPQHAVLQHISKFPWSTQASIQSGTGLPGPAVNTHLQALMQAGHVTSRPNAQVPMVNEYLATGAGMHALKAGVTNAAPAGSQTPQGGATPAPQAQPAATGSHLQGAGAFHTGGTHRVSGASQSNPNAAYHYEPGAAGQRSGYQAPHAAAASPSGSALSSGESDILDHLAEHGSADDNALASALPSSHLSEINSLKGHGYIRTDSAGNHSLTYAGLKALNDAGGELPGIDDDWRSATNGTPVTNLAYEALNKAATPPAGESPAAQRAFTSADKMQRVVNTLVGHYGSGKAAADAIQNDEDFKAALGDLKHALTNIHSNRVNAMRAGSPRQAQFQGEIQHYRYMRDVVSDAAVRGTGVYIVAGVGQTATPKAAFTVPAAQAPPATPAAQPAPASAPPQAAPASATPPQAAQAATHVPGTSVSVTPAEQQVLDYFNRSKKSALHFDTVRVGGNFKQTDLLQHIHSLEQKGLVARDPGSAGKPTHKSRWQLTGAAGNSAVTPHATAAPVTPATPAPAPQSSALDHAFNVPPPGGYQIGPNDSFIKYGAKAGSLPGAPVYTTAIRAGRSTLPVDLSQAGPAAGSQPYLDAEKYPDRNHAAAFGMSYQGATGNVVTVVHGSDSNSLKGGTVSGLRPGGTNAYGYGLYTWADSANHTEARGYTKGTNYEMELHTGQCIHSDNVAALVAKFGHEHTAAYQALSHNNAKLQAAACLQYGYSCIVRDYDDYGVKGNAPAYIVLDPSRCRIKSVYDNSGNALPLPNGQMSPPPSPSVMQPTKSVLKNRKYVPATAWWGTPDLAAAKDPTLVARNQAIGADPNVPLSDNGYKVIQNIGQSVAGKKLSRSVIDSARDVARMIRPVRGVDDAATLVSILNDGALVSIQELKRRHAAAAADTTPHGQAEATRLASAIAKAHANQDDKTLGLDDSVFLTYGSPTAFNSYGDISLVYKPEVLNTPGAKVNLHGVYAYNGGQDGQVNKAAWEANEIDAMEAPEVMAFQLAAGYPVTKASGSKSSTGAPENGALANPADYLGGHSLTAKEQAECHIPVSVSHHHISHILIPAGATYTHPGVPTAAAHPHWNVTPGLHDSLQGTSRRYRADVYQQMNGGYNGQTITLEGQPLTLRYVNHTAGQRWQFEVPGATPKTVSLKSHLETLCKARGLDIQVVETNSAGHGRPHHTNSITSRSYGSTPAYQKICYQELT